MNNREAVDTGKLLEEFCGVVMDAPTWDRLCDKVGAALDARDKELVAAAWEALRLIRNGIALRLDGLAFDADEVIRKARNTLNAALVEGQK